MKVHGWTVTLLRFALEHADGVGGRLFTRWTNSRRDIHIACRKANIEPASLVDFRRTAATWMRESGIALDLVARAMGHRDSTMVERVYGRIKVREAAVLMQEQLALHGGLSVSRRESASLVLPSPKPGGAGVAAESDGLSMVYQRRARPRQP
ncbi:MAG: tyrosine-type recombinase/integrase [Deltaproteobacteria bacterium]|nr:tyrosine-type recombinase/integrase [Deltaproteobacteria bacterium]